MTDVAFHSTDQRGYQSQLLVAHSSGGCCNFWGLLYSDDRRSLWWASRDGPQQDRSRSDFVMISMDFNSYSLVIFLIIPALFSFFFCIRNYRYYTSVSCVWLLLPYVSLQSNWAWKPSKLGLSISFSLWVFSSLLEPFFSSSVATCRLACSKISHSVKEKS